MNCLLQFKKQPIKKNTSAISCNHPAIIECSSAVSPAFLSMFRKTEVT